MTPHDLSPCAWAAYIAGQHKMNRDAAMSEARQMTLPNFRKLMVQNARKSHWDYMKFLRVALGRAS